MNPLTSPAITELTTETAPLNLLGEWLRGWFNGSLHAVGAAGTVFFPAVNLAFNQSAAIQPQYQLGAGIDTTIRVVLVPRGEQAVSLDTVLFSGKLVTARVLVNFYVQAKHPGAGQAQQSAQTVANLLKAILTNPDARYPLALKGITAFAPEPIRPQAGTDYAGRLVVCSAQLQYPVQFGMQPLPVGGAVTVNTTEPWPQSLEWWQPAALVSNEYLLGTFTAACALRFTAVRVVAFAPQTAPVVLGLEVAGAPSGVTVTLPPGVVNAEVQTSVPLALTLATGQVARWKVLAAPAAADSAWRASVEVTALPLPN